MSSYFFSDCKSLIEVKTAYW